MKYPRDVSGRELAKRLERFGYAITRQTGSHLRLASTMRGAVHRVTVPAHGYVRIGTLSNIIGDIAQYLERDKQRLLEELFE